MANTLSRRPRVANAAVHFGDRMARVHEFDLDAWSKTWRWPAGRLPHLAWIAILSAGGGSIVCTGSPNGLRGQAEALRLAPARAA